MYTLLAIDPGTVQSGYVKWNGRTIVDSGVCPNTDLLLQLPDPSLDYLAIENISSYGQKVGNTTFDTCVWIGRFYQAWLPYHSENTVHLIKRHTIKSHLCPNIKSNDSKVMAALINRFGDKGTKSSPGFTYGLKSHAWQAFALAVYCSDTILKNATIGQSLNIKND